jgi:hypothetical protein
MTATLDYPKLLLREDFFVLFSFFKKKELKGFEM